MTLPEVDDARLSEDPEVRHRVVELIAAHYEHWESNPGLFVRHGLLDPAQAGDMRTWRGTGGFCLDGSVRVEAHDRAGLERLIRYCARPPYALHRQNSAPTRAPCLR